MTMTESCENTPIDLPPTKLPPINLPCRLSQIFVGALTDEQMANLLPWPEKDAHKYSRGCANIFAGSKKYPGAACLAALAASRMGAGYVKVFCDKHAIGAIRMHMPSAVVTPWNEAEFSDENTPSAPKAYVLGPGLDEQDTASRIITEEVIDAATRNNIPLLIDGGALSILSCVEGIELLRAYAATNQSGVITPHVGEARRLAHAIYETYSAQECRSSQQHMSNKHIHSHEEFHQAMENMDDKLLAAFLCGILKLTVCVKGSNTYIAIPPSAFYLSHANDEKASAVKKIIDDEKLRNDNSSFELSSILYTMSEGTPALAKAGTGDVLAGMVGSLLSQGLSAENAAILGCTLHARAGVAGAEELNNICIMPEDVISHIPHAIKYTYRKAIEQKIKNQEN